VRSAFSSPRDQPVILTIWLRVEIEITVEDLEAGWGELDAGPDRWEFYIT
jgi:hypothetical protein